MLVAAVAPLVMIVWVSFWQLGWAATGTHHQHRGVGLGAAAIRPSTGWRGRRLQTVIIVLALVGVLGLAAGYFLARFVTNRKLQALLLMLAILPFWTSYLIRIITWQPLFGNSGVINFLLAQAGLPQMELFLFNQRAMIFAMTSLYVVFVIGPVFWALSRIDPEVIAASRSLGASAWTTFRTVELPLARGGLVVGLFFASIFLFGDYATGRLIGGGTNPHAVGRHLAVRRLGAVAGRRGAGGRAVRAWPSSCWRSSCGSTTCAQNCRGIGRCSSATGNGSSGIVGGGDLRPDPGRSSTRPSSSWVSSPSPSGQRPFSRRRTSHSSPIRSCSTRTTSRLFRIPGEPLVNYLRPIGLSLTLALLTSIIATTLALMAALAFRQRFRGRGIVFYALLLGMVTPGIILGLGFRLFADQIGLPTGWRTTGLLTHIAWTMPFGFIVFLVFLNRFDHTIEEAASRPRRQRLDDVPHGDAARAGARRPCLAPVRVHALVR